MKISTSSTDEQAFKPFHFKVTVETKDEFDALYALFLRDCCGPALAQEFNPEIKTELLTEFFIRMINLLDIHNDSL